MFRSSRPPCRHLLGSLCTLEIFLRKKKLHVMNWQEVPAKLYRNIDIIDNKTYVFLFDFFDWASFSFALDSFPLRFPTSRDLTSSSSTNADKASCPAVLIRKYFTTLYNNCYYVLSELLLPLIIDLNSWFSLASLAYSSDNARIESLCSLSKT